MNTYKPTVPMRDPLDTWYFEDISNGIRKCIEFAYSLKRKNLNQSVPYVGPELTSSSLLGGSPDVKETLSSAWLKESEEGQGRDALQEIIGCAIRLGVEQGLRMVRKEHPKFRMRNIRNCIEQAHSNPFRDRALEDLEDLERKLNQPGGIGGNT